MSSAFCNIQRVANIVVYLLIVSLTFSSRQFMKFSISCRTLLKFESAFLLILLLAGLGFRTEFVVTYVDIFNTNEVVGIYTKKTQCK
jgi:hypothetical protein